FAPLDDGFVAEHGGDLRLGLRDHRCPGASEYGTASGGGKQGARAVGGGGGVEGGPFVGGRVWQRNGRRGLTNCGLAPGTGLSRGDDVVAGAGHGETELDRGDGAFLADEADVRL